PLRKTSLIPLTDVPGSLKQVTKPHVGAHVFLSPGYAIKSKASCGAVPSALKASLSYDIAASLAEQTDVASIVMRYPDVIGFRPWWNASSGFADEMSLLPPPRSSKSTTTARG